MTFDKKNVKVTLFIIFISILFFWGVQRISVIYDFFVTLANILMPFIAGAAIAFVVNVPMKKIEKILPGKLGKARRPLAYALTLVCVCAFLGFALFVVIPQTSRTIASLAQQVPKAFDSASKYVENIMRTRPEIAVMIKNLDLDFEALGKQAMNIFQDSAKGILNVGVNIISSLINGIVAFIISFIFSIYILMQKEKLAKQAKQVIYSFLPVSISDRIVRVVRMSNKAFSNFISGQCLEALILGIMFFIVLSVFRFPYALLISVVITISALVPIVGAFVGCALGCFLILMVNPLRALIFVGVFLILQQIEGNLIYPHVVGSSVGLPSIWVLVAVIVGAETYGAIGILVFIPLASVLYALFKESVRQRLKERKITEERLS